MHASCGAYTPRASRHLAPRRRQRTSHHRQDLHDGWHSRRGPSHAPRSAWGLLSAFRRRLAAITRPHNHPAPSQAQGPNLRARMRPKRRPRGEAEERARTLGKVLPSPSLMLTTLTPCRGVPRRRGVSVSASAGRLPRAAARRQAKQRAREGGCLAFQLPPTRRHVAPRDGCTRRGSGWVKGAPGSPLRHAPWLLRAEGGGRHARKSDKRHHFLHDFLPSDFSRLSLAAPAGAGAAPPPPPPPPPP